MTTTQHRINCAHCKGIHHTAEQVKACSQGIRLAYASNPANPVPAEPMTKRQCDFIEKLSMQKYNTAPLNFPSTKDSASALIKHLLDQPDYVAPAPEPKRVYQSPRQSVLMVELLEDLPDGFYAAQLQEGDPIRFYRVKFQKRNRFAGAKTIQQAHGSVTGLTYTNSHVLWPSGKISVYNWQNEDPLTIVLADPHSAALLFAQHIGRCMRCNAALTDERSRYYGIGPECEKFWPWVVPAVDEDKGAYRA